VRQVEETIKISKNPTVWLMNILQAEEENDEIDGN
jgi:hypothetical protein